MAGCRALGALIGLVSQAFQPIIDLLDDERFTEEERARLENSNERARIAPDRMELEIQKMDLQLQIAEVNRKAEQERADAAIAQALADVQAAQTREDDLFTKRLRPTAGYLMTFMLVADQAWVMLGHERFFDWRLLTGYFGLMGIYMTGRSLEKIKRKQG